MLLKGGSLVVTGDITAGSLQFSAVFDLCWCTYCNAWLIFSDIMKAVGASDRVFEILNRGQGST